MTEIILWRRIDLPGHDIACLDPLADGWKLSGTAIFSSPQGPAHLDYAIFCDPAWRTKSAHITGSIGAQPTDLSLSVTADRRWYLNGVECAEVEGCLDLDLGFSPSTNLLPIRRLALAVGQQAEVRAAWLPFPSLRFELLPQIYRRLTDRTYRYESSGGRFVRTLDVNAAGFVTHYPGLWQVDGS